jgi:hypothetical protein
VQVPPLPAVPAIGRAEYAVVPVCRGVRQVEAWGLRVGCGCATNRVDRDLCNVHEEIARKMVLIRVLQMALFLVEARA